MSQKKLLDSIQEPARIKEMTTSELDQLAEEIRCELIHTISNNGGHLASNLGVVELTLAIHRVFDSPKDKIVWDVGHQSYTHKLICGRRDTFHTIRKKGGISGFPKPYESEHDAFIAGHSSTSVSVAYGFAEAMRCKGDHHHAIAVLGDGSMTGGMVYEALNNAGRSNCNLIVVLNDNEMSISKNVGALSNYLTDLRTKPAYFRLKDFVERCLLKIPFIGKKLCNAVMHSKTMLRHMLYKNTMFEDFGFVYLGPVDGHDIDRLTTVLERARQLNRPVLIHVNTIKGKGYSFAEENPTAYHGVSQFDSEKGAEQNSASSNFSSVFGKTLSELADKNDRICAITAAMLSGTGLQYFAPSHSNRLYDVGIAEEHAITFAAGLAKGGMIPFVALYSTFLQRGYDQLVHDVGISGQKVILAVDRAGIVGDDGETHQGVFDVGLLTQVPNLEVFSPSNYAELRMCMAQVCDENYTFACAIRYPRGKEDCCANSLCAVTDYMFYSSPLKSTAKILLITYGKLAYACESAQQMLADQEVAVDLLKLVQISPLDPCMISRAAEYDHIFFVEEGMQHGGIAEHMAAILAAQDQSRTFHIRAILDYVPHQSVDEAYEELGFTAEKISTWVHETMQVKS